MPAVPYGEGLGVRRTIHSRLLEIIVPRVRRKRPATPSPALLSAGPNRGHDSAAAALPASCHPCCPAASVGTIQEQCSPDLRRDRCPRANCTRFPSPPPSRSHTSH